MSTYKQRIKNREAKQKHKEIRDSYRAEFSGMITEMFSRVVNTKYIIHCGKTNSGKTYQAIEALKRNGGGVYLAPLRLLAWEIYDKLNQQGYPCSLVTGEEQVTTANERYVASTIEMLDYSREYDTAVIDEAFYIGDKDRGKSWLKAILDCKAREVHIITNEEALQIIQSILKLTKRNYETNNYEMLQKFKFAEYPLSNYKNLGKGGVFVTFSRINALIEKMRLESMGYTVSVLYGNLPPEVKKKQIEGFINGDTDLMVTTDVIGAGVNVPANYLVFLEAAKFDGVSRRPLLPMEVKQIAGRCGRYGLSSEDSFVSAVSGSDLKFIKNEYNKNVSVAKAFVGLDWAMFSAFPEDFTVVQRVRAFAEMNFIPPKLRQYISKESIAKYDAIANEVDRKTFYLDVKWTFLTAPYKKNNDRYFRQCLNSYATIGIIKAPTFLSKDQYYEIQSLEDNISEIELYMNLVRTLKHIPIEKELMGSIKDILTDKLQEMLLDRKLSHKKKCKLCPEYIELQSRYAYCDNCYQEKVRSSYFDYY